MPLCREKCSVGPGGEPVERVIRFEPCEAHADPNADVVLDRPVDHLESALDLVDVDPADSTHELVTAVTNDRVEGAQVRSHGPDECLQDMIAGGVTIAVVDALHSVDVDEGDNEPPIGAQSAVDLMPESDPACLAAKRSREVVKVGAVQLGLQARTLRAGLGSISGGLVSIGGGNGSISGGFVSIGGGTKAGR